MDMQTDSKPESSVSDVECADTETTNESGPSQMSAQTSFILETSSQHAMQSEDGIMEHAAAIPKIPSGEETDLLPQTSMHSPDRSFRGERSLEMAESDPELMKTNEEGQLKLTSDHEGIIVPIGGTITKETTQATAIFEGREAEEFLKGSKLPAKMWEDLGADRKELHLHFTKSTANIANAGAISIGGNVILKPSKEDVPKKQKSKFQILRDKLGQQIHQWTEGMVETNAVKMITSKMQEGHSIVMVTGCPGEGKTTTAYLALKKLQDMGREVYEARTPEGYFTAREARGSPIIMLGDIWGSSCFSRDKFSSWEGVLEDALGLHGHKFKSERDQCNSPRLQLQQPQIILVTRQSVLSSASHHLGKYKNIILGKENQVNLSDEKTLSTDEKMKIWYYHSKLHDVEIDERIVRKVCMMSLPHGFPHICHLFTSMHAKYSNIGMESFFRKPIDFLNQSLESLLEESVAGPLLRTMLKNDGVLSLKTIDDDEKVYQYQTVVDRLKQTYLKQTGDEVTFHHPSIYDSAAFVVCRKSPRFAILNCTMSFLNQMVCFDGLENGVQETKMSIHVENNYINCFLDRLKREFDGRNFTGLFAHVSFYDKEFTSRFMDTILPEKGSHNQDQLRNLLQLKDKTSCVSFLFHITESRSNILLKYILERLALTEKEQSDALLGIIENDSEASLRCLFTACPKLNVDKPIQGSLTPLLLAARKQTTGVLKLLIQRGADVKGSDSKGNTALHLMCMNAVDDCGDIVTLLSDKGIDVNTASEEGLFPLHEACHQGNLYAVAALIQNGADVNNMDGHGFLPVHTASIFQHTPVLLHLLANGADIDAESIHGETPLHIACMLGVNSQLNTLIENGADLNSGRYSNPIHCACANGNETALSILLEKGVDINCKGKCGLFSPLHMACWSGNDMLVKILLDRGADIESAAMGKATPLHLACMSRNEAILKLLLKKGGLVNVGDKEGNTPLHLACHMNVCKVQSSLLNTHNQCRDALLGDTELTSLQSKKNADIIQSDLMAFWETAPSENEAETILYKVTSVMTNKLRGPNLNLTGTGNDNIVNILLDNGAQCNIMNNVGHTPLHNACLSGDNDSLRLLIGRGADVNGGGIVTPLQMSSSVGNNTAINILCDNGAKVNKIGVIGPLHSAAAFGRNDTVACLLERGAIVDLAVIGRLTPLHYASIAGYSDVIQNLVSNGANVNRKCAEGLSPLHLSCQAHHVKAVEVLLNNGANVNDTVWFSEDTPLHLACSETDNNDIDSLSEMLKVLKKATDVDVPMESPACEEVHDLSLLINKNIKQVKDHMSDGSAVEAVCMQVGNDVLNYFAENSDLPVTTNNKELISHLLNRGADTNKQNVFGNTALHVACKEGNVGIVTALLHNGADMNRKNEEEATPLHAAASGGHLAVVKALLDEELQKGKREACKQLCPDDVDDITSQTIDEGQNSDRGDKDSSVFTEGQSLKAGRVAIDSNEHVTQSHGNMEGMPDQETDKYSTDPWFSPFHMDSSETPWKAEGIHKTEDVNAADTEGHTPLHLACMKGHKDVGELLLKNGADLSIKDKKGWTSLYLACCEGHESTVTMLLNNGAEADQKLTLGYRPLHVASLNNCNGDVVRKLLDCNAEVNSATDEGLTPLHLVCEENANSVDLMETLLARGADVNKVNSVGDTPLHAACQNGHIDVVTCLLDRGADVNKGDNYGSSPLHDACEKGYCNIVTILLNRDADVNKVGNSRCTPLHDACTNGHKDVVLALLNKDADVGNRDYSGGTPLHDACENGHNDVVVALLDRGANVGEIDTSGCIPLHRACANGHCDVVATLIERSSDVGKVDNSGSTPLHKACEKGHCDVVTFLLNRGADLNKGDNSGNTPLHLLAKLGQGKVARVMLDKASK